MHGLGSSNSGGVIGTILPIFGGMAAGGVGGGGQGEFQALSWGCVTYPVASHRTKSNTNQSIKKVGLGGGAPYIYTYIYVCDIYIWAFIFIFYIHTYIYIIYIYWSKPGSIKHSPETR